MHPERAGAERRTRRVESEARVAENPRSAGGGAATAKGGRDFQVNAGALSRDASRICCSRLPQWTTCECASPLRRLPHLCTLHALYTLLYVFLRSSPLLAIMLLNKLLLLIFAAY